MSNNNFEVKELLRSQVTNCDPDRLLEILQSEAYLINFEDLTKLDSDRNSALHFALSVRHYDLTRFLIEKYSGLQSIKNTNGWTASAVFVDKVFSTNGDSSLARWALDDKKIKLLTFLLDKPNLISEDTKAILQTPPVFHTLLFHNENDLLKRVIGLAIDANKESIIFTADEGSWDAREKYSYVLRNFISLAAKQGNLPIVKFLLEIGVHPNVYEYGFAYGVGDISHNFELQRQPLLQLVIKAIDNTKAVDKKKSLYAIRNSLITAMFIDRSLRGETIDFPNYRYEVLQRIWLQLMSLPCTDANKQNRDDVEARFRNYLYHARQNKPFFSNFNLARESDPDLYRAYLLLNVLVESAHNVNLALHAYMQYLKRGGREYSKIEDVIKQRSSEFLKKDPKLVEGLFLYYRQKGGKHFSEFYRQIEARKDIPGLPGYIECFTAFQNYQNAIKPIEGSNEIIIQDKEKFDRSIKTIKAFAKSGLGLASFLLSEIFAYNFVMEKENEDCVVVQENAEVEVEVIMPADPINVFLYAVTSAREKVPGSSVTFKDSMLFPYGYENRCQLSADKTLKDALIAAFCTGERLDRLFDVFGSVLITENKDKTCTLVFAEVLKNTNLNFTINSEQRKHILQNFQNTLSRLESNNVLLYDRIKNAIAQLSLSQEATEQVQLKIVTAHASKLAAVQLDVSLDQIPGIDAAFSEIDKLADKIEGRSQVTLRSLAQENLKKPAKDGFEDVLLEEIVTSANAPTFSELTKGPEFTLLDLVERDLQLAFLQSPKTAIRYSRDLTELAGLMSFDEPGSGLNVESSIPDVIPVSTVDLSASISTGSKLATQEVLMLSRTQEKGKDDAVKAQEKDKDKMVSVKLSGKVGFFKEPNFPAVPTHNPAEEETKAKEKRVAQRAN